VLSATVSAPSGALAEAVATCAFIWRVPEFIDWLPSVNAAAVLVLDDGSVLRGGQWEQAA
jgi:thiamine biosynthesis lipoprotein ApbE